MLFAEESLIKKVLEDSPPGSNTRFLSSSHSLWTRFKNYKNNPPMMLTDGEQPVCFIFATFNRDKYVNLYEIVTVEGQEGNGYASEMWDQFVEYATQVRGCTRLKISCTPSSIGWHVRNGLIFWAVDPTGSLRSDQPLFKNREEQFIFQKIAIADPHQAIPPNEKVVAQLRKESLESHGFGEKKTQKTLDAIEAVGDAWLRPALFDPDSVPTLDEWLL
jgi:hypothetical protein